MKIKTMICAGMLLLTSGYLFAQDDDWNHISNEDIISRDSFSRKGYTLIFINKSSAFDTAVKQRMVNTFFKVYPKQAELYNVNTSKQVIFVIDPKYTGVAAASGDIVRFNPLWFEKNPGDIDVVTHEVMHIIQSYPGDAGPGWVTEGIADYVRYTMGVDNAGAGWTLPPFSTTQSYNDAYRITARFFVWAEQHYNKKLVKKLDTAMRGKTYNSNLWRTLTGKTVDELWKEYSLNPAI